ncbi:DsbA family protein [Vibrio parahaemolyticus]|uniref:DsbA family protein n=1 Tax=Vibrio parahaemolyticus TaxID=670 RepID=UPI001A2B1A2D|nr:DsbA family protein [Vibrio parahaemolyticus]HAS6776232.1 thioredoxin domain-containing protein [Vibrio parahaemolyticus]HAS6991971.1 thioredoxin domain-containing protein [Vibrio parahaemolyticus]
MTFTRTLLALTMAIVPAVSFASEKTSEQKLEEITQILKENPQILDSLHQNLQEYVAYQQSFGDTLKEVRHYLNDGKHSSFGAETPELTIINVTDYSCPFCKRLEGELVKVGKEYPQIKVLNLNVSFKEQYEKNGYNSASYALNVWQNQRDKYEQVHELLVKKPGAHDARSLKQIAKKTGTEAQLVDDKETKALLDKNYQYFTQLGLRGTPALIINDQIIPGYVPFDELEKVIDQELAN